MIWDSGLDHCLIEAPGRPSDGSMNPVIQWCNLVQSLNSDPERPILSPFGRNPLKRQALSKEVYTPFALAFR